MTGPQQIPTRTDTLFPYTTVFRSRRREEGRAELGARRRLGRGDADLDIDTVAIPGLRRALEVAGETGQAQPPLATVTPLRAATDVGSRDQPFSAEVLANQRITFGSDKDIRHIELALADSGLHYEPGDAPGV